MLLPLDVVLRRGVVFLWPRYAELDDPALIGRTKPKFLVILSSSSQDDPIVYILTASEKAKYASHPHPQDLVHVAAGSHGFLPVDTVIDAGTAGDREIDRDALVALYQTGDIVYQGVLGESFCTELLGKIARSRRVTVRVKQVLGLVPPRHT